MKPQSVKKFRLVWVGFVLLSMSTHARDIKGSEPSGSVKGATQKEFGLFGSLPSFSSFSMPSFSSFSTGTSKSVENKPKTVEPSSSLTGLTWVMSFEQQMRGGLPVAQWPPRLPGTQPGSTPSPPPQGPPAAPSPPAQQVTPSQPSTAPAAATPPAESTACSTTDTSGSAVFSCVNAMRMDPHAWTPYYQCNWQSWINSVSNPKRGALRTDSRLASSSALLARDMAGTRTVSHVGADGSTMAQRIAASGFQTYPQAENVAGGQGSAREVAAAWMCSDSHRENLMSCSIDSVGTSTAYDVNGRAYYVQDFGCSVTNACRC